MKVTQTILATVLALSPLLASVHTSAVFYMTQCACGDNSLARRFATNYIRSDGAEVGISVNRNLFCDGKSNPTTCTYSFDLFEMCSDSNQCGVGNLCYNVEITSSDTFGINGNTYTKNDYSSSKKSMTASSDCDELCSINGKYQENAETGNSYQWTITGFPEPQGC